MHENYNYVCRFVSRFLIIYFCILIGSLCQAQTTVTSQDSPNDQIPGSVERIVKIDKELIPWKDSYSLGESPRVLVEVKFIKYKNIKWNLNNVRINEMFDENIEIKDGSFGLAIGSIEDINKYRTAETSVSQDEFYSIKKVSNNKFEIQIDKEFDSSNRIFYWYNINVKKPGVFNTDTVIISNPGIGIYSDADQSMRLQIDNFNPITTHWSFLRDLIYILSLLIGLFTFYKQIIIGKKEIHLRDFLSDIINEFSDLIQAIPRSLIVGFSLIILYISSYSYFRPLYPEIYHPLDLFLKSNWDKYSEIMLMIILLIFTLVILYVNNISIEPVKSVHEWFRKIIKSIFVDMPPVIAFTLFMLLYALPLLLVILNL
jgi:hypothetical protein